MNIDLSSHALDFSELRYIADRVVVPEGKKVRKDSLLICTASGSKSHLGKIAYIDDDYGYAFGGFMGMLTPGPEVEPRYLLHLMASRQYEDFIGSLTDGVNINNLKFSDLASFLVRYPTLPEQRRIVAILDEAVADIAVAKANAKMSIQNASAVFESELRLVFRENGERSDEQSLASVCDISSALVDPRLPEYRDLPHVGGANIESKTGELTELKTAREEGLKSGKFVFDETMVLYSKIRPYLMKVARPGFKGLCSADIYPLSTNQAVLDRDYLFHLLLAPEFTDYAISGSARAGMPKVNRDHLFAFRVHLPSLPAQKALANRLDAVHLDCRRLESVYERKLAALDELRQSLLHQAFTGRLTA